MPWNQRQVRMLDAMGLRVWREAAAPAPAPVPLPARADARVPAPAASPVPAPIAPREPAPAAAATARPLATDPSTLNWPALREAVASCRACGLCESRRQTVFGVGSETAQWLIVGEAPGEQEDREGEPFVGAAGQMLDRMLHALHLTRRADDDGGAHSAAQRVFITNTLKCRPPGNRNPTAEELALCQPFLDRQIALLKPRLVLAMGRFAVQALLGSELAIGKLRGRVHRIDRHGGLPVIVTYHPSYLLRTPTEKAKAWEDLCLAAETFEAAAS